MRSCAGSKFSMSHDAWGKFQTPHDKALCKVPFDPSESALSYDDGYMLVLLLRHYIIEGLCRVLKDSDSCADWWWGGTSKDRRDLSFSMAHTPYMH